MTKTDPFALYKMPLGLTEGVDIPLLGTPAVFRCILPGTMNEDFNMELISSMNAKPDDDGNISVDTSVFQRTRKKLFFDTCIVRATGLPKDMTPTLFFAAYPLAARSIFDRATELAVIADDEANAALGKFKPMPNGKSSGAESLNSMTPSSQVESTSKHVGQN